MRRKVRWWGTAELLEPEDARLRGPQHEDGVELGEVQALVEDVHGADVVQPALRELVQRLGPGGARLARVDGHGAPAVLPQEVGHEVRVALGDAEGQGAGPAALLELLEGVSGPGTPSTRSQRWTRFSSHKARRSPPSVRSGVAVRPSRNFDDAVEAVAREAFEVGDAAEGLDRREEDVGVWLPLLARVEAESGVGPDPSEGVPGLRIPRTLRVLGMTGGGSRRR